MLYKEYEGGSDGIDLNGTSRKMPSMWFWVGSPRLARTCEYAGSPGSLALLELHKRICHRRHLWREGAANRWHHRTVLYELGNGMKSCGRLIGRLRTGIWLRQHGKSQASFPEQRSGGTPLPCRRQAGRGPDEWIELSPHREGSWWTEWVQFLESHSGEQVAPPLIGGSQGSAGLKDAPGDYVKQR